MIDDASSLDIAPWTLLINDYPLSEKKEFTDGSKTEKSSRCSLHQTFPGNLLLGDDSSL